MSQVGSPLRDCITAKTQDVPPPVPEKPSPRTYSTASPPSTASSSPLSSLSGILPLPPSLMTPEAEAPPPPPPPKDIGPVPPPKPVRRQSRSVSQPRSSSREGLNTSPWNASRQQLTSKPSHPSELRIHNFVPTQHCLEKEHGVLRSRPLASPPMTRTIGSSGGAGSRSSIWNLDGQLSPAEGSALVLSLNDSTGKTASGPVMASFTLSSSRSRSDSTSGKPFKLSTVFSKRSRPTPNTLISGGRFNAAFLPPPIPVYANRDY